MGNGLFILPVTSHQSPVTSHQSPVTYSLTISYKSSIITSNIRANL
ncbi:hypothetical protein PN497_05105 [Sphaerospermopsis kisseleviana CS-549]|uniref:Uncharacterized protein n=1 Tax=Sphaerospermopsis kisseleviana CS-549 TaxID=3021783 RepID=A0ABT4ZMX8_9CYAN|nr:hypothetical protein [Sphaerospermopsis kisseleviana]MDB9440740.1 hypothetical protein [Sphaerospermopsis kisseleviana CS-549]